MQAAVARNHAGIACAEQRRTPVIGRKLGELGDHSRARIVDRGAGGRGVRGAAGDAGIRQVGCSGLELDLVEIEAETVGGDLRERGPGALAHVMRAGLHHAGAVGLDHRARLGREHQRGKRRGAHAPADQEAVIVTHAARQKRPLRPAEALGALCVAFAQGLG